MKGGVGWVTGGPTFVKVLSNVEARLFILKVDMWMSMGLVFQDGVVGASVAHVREGARQRVKPRAYR